jgi:hypothetical protein
MCEEDDTGSAGLGEPIRAIALTWGDGFEALMRSDDEKGDPYHSPGRGWVESQDQLRC